MRLSEWIEKQLSFGNFTFTTADAAKAMKTNEKAVRLGLFRLVKKHKIQSVYQGLYAIIPAQYQNIGGLPPMLYIDDLMKIIQCDYYVSHLSAAALHGATHQQAQEYYVIHNGRSLRKAKKGIMPINFIRKENWASSSIEKRKTETGYLLVSSPMATALDLVKDQSKIGGMNRVSTIMNELADDIIVTEDALRYHSSSTIQRLGYILDHIGCTELAHQLFSISFQAQKPKHRYPLVSNKKSTGYSSKNRWNIVYNTIIEIDE